MPYPFSIKWTTLPICLVSFNMSMMFNLLYIFYKDKVITGDSTWNKDLENPRSWILDLQLFALFEIFKIRYIDIFDRFTFDPIELSSGKKDKQHTQYIFYKFETRQPIEVSIDINLSSLFFRSSHGILLTNEEHRSMEEQFANPQAVYRKDALLYLWSPNCEKNWKYNITEQRA